MFSKTIEYEDFNGNKTSQVFYFHASKADLLEMTAEGEVMLKRIQRMIEAKDNRAILKEFRAIIEMAAGVRSEDGQRFIKTPEAKSILMDSPAYDELLMELCTQADAAAEFINNLLPEKMQKEMREQMAKLGNSETTVELPDESTPAWIREDRDPTHAELAAMSPDELRAAFRRKIDQKGGA